MLLEPEGNVATRRIRRKDDVSCEVPFRFPINVDYSARRVAAVIHAFYPEGLPEIVALLQAGPCRFDLFISTDTTAKKAVIEAMVARYENGSVEVRIVPNRGRDIAPKLIAFRDVYARFDLFLHLHTKRSIHDASVLSGWAGSMQASLIGSPETICSILYLFEKSWMGIVFPQHFAAIRKGLNWGFNYDRARQLLERMGIPITSRQILDFPAGSMFWGRSAAIQPLIDLDLKVSDFPEENGQLDGTIAHAIERSILFIAESRHFEWIKISSLDVGRSNKAVIPILGDSDLERARRKIFNPCLSVLEQSPFLARVWPELGSVPTFPDRSEKPRLTFLAPSMTNRVLDGNLALAIMVFDNLCSKFGDAVDQRRLETDRFDRSSTLEIRKQEVFLAFNWPDARLALQLGRDQERFFGRSLGKVFFYLADDPHDRRNRAWLRNETFAHAPADCVAVCPRTLQAQLGDGLLSDTALVLPEMIHPSLAGLLLRGERERLILVDGLDDIEIGDRALLLDGIYTWQKLDPTEADRWRIKFLVTKSDRASPLPHCEFVTINSVDAYIRLLSRASIGLSLTSRAAACSKRCDMHAAGLMTITASPFVTRSTTVQILESPSPDELAHALEQAVDMALPHLGFTGQPVPAPGARTTLTSQVNKLVAGLDLFLAGRFSNV